MLWGRKRAVIIEREITGSQEGNGIQPEAPFLAKLGQRLTCERRAHRHGQIELDGIERNGIRHVFAIHQRRNQRLIRRPAK